MPGGGSFDGLNEEHLGQKFQHRGESYTLIGFKPRAKRDTLLVRRDEDDVVYRFSEDVVAAGMAKASAT